MGRGYLTFVMVGGVAVLLSIIARAAGDANALSVHLGGDEMFAFAHPV
jgi:hypothetical protein